MRKFLLGLAALCSAAIAVAQQKNYDLYVVAEGNFGTPNGDVYKVSRLDSFTVNTSGALYQTANNTAGIDVLQDFGIFGDKAVLCGKGANPVKLAIVSFPSFDSIKTFTTIGGIQCLGKASDAKAYASMATGSSLQMLDLATGNLNPVNDPSSLLSSYASYMVQAQGFMYVAIGSKIVKVDTATNTATSSFVPGIGGIAGMQYDPASNCIWLLGKVSGTSALVKLEPANNDLLHTPIVLTGITNAAQLRFALNKLYFLSGKNVHAYNISSPNIPTPLLYTSSLGGSSFSFAYGKSFDVDPLTGDFALATAGNFAQPSAYEIVDGTTFQVIDTGSVAGRIANELVLHTYSTPEPDTVPLPAVYAQCAVTLSPPTAMAGNVIVTGTTADPLSYNSQGSYTVTWTFTNGNNTVSHTQQVVVEDTIAPVPDVVTLPALQGSCPYTLVPPAATDNCSGSITGTTDSLLFTVAGTYTVNWQYDDGHGNSTIQPQQLTIACTPSAIGDADKTGIAFTCYPNPATNFFTLAITEPGKGYQLRIFNTLGQPVWQQKITARQTTLSLRDLPAGIYSVQLLEEGTTRTALQKLLIR